MKNRIFSSFCQRSSARSVIQKKREETSMRSPLGKYIWTSKSKKKTLGLSEPSFQFPHTTFLPMGGNSFCPTKHTTKHNVFDLRATPCSCCTWILSIRPGWLMNASWKPLETESLRHRNYIKLLLSSGVSKPSSFTKKAVLRILHGTESLVFVSVYHDYFFEGLSNCGFLHLRRLCPLPGCQD